MKVAQSCLTLSDPIDYTVHGILQARILELVAFSFSRGSSQPRDQTQVSCIAEKAEEVVKKKKKNLLHEIILRLGLSRSLQSENGILFTSKVTQGVSKALGITYLHCAWRPQSSGKVEKANQFLKSALKKITQETSLGWKALPIALPHNHIAP